MIILRCSNHRIGARARQGIACCSAATRCARARPRVQAALQQPEVATSVGELGFKADLKGAYDVLDLVGSGAWGQVAVKVMSKARNNRSREDTLEKLCKEVSLLQSMGDCPGLAHYVDCFEDEDSVQLVTELCQGGDLKKYVEAHGPLNESTLAAVAVDVLRMLQGCHSRGVLYADVKPANFCLRDAAAFSREAATPPFVQAVDFGCSQRIDSGRLLTRTGSFAFMAPEAFRLDFAYKADVWSLGVTLYWLSTARLPFWDNAELAKLSKIEDVTAGINKAPIPYDYGPWLSMSAEGLDFMRACLTRPEEERMGVDEALRHPWLAKYAEDSFSHALVNTTNEVAV